MVQMTRVMGDDTTDEQDVDRKLRKLRQKQKQGQKETKREKQRC